MVLTLSPQLESALAAQASRRGMAPAALAIEVLQRQLVTVAAPVPCDEWEQKLFNAAVDCGISISDVALSSDGLYE